MNHTTDFSEIAESHEKSLLSLLENFTPTTTTTVMCGFLQYVSDNGRVFNYLAISAGILEAVMYLGATFSSRSGRIHMRKGDTYMVGIIAGQNHGFICW